MENFPPIQLDRGLGPRTVEAYARISKACSQAPVSTWQSDTRHPERQPSGCSTRASATAVSRASLGLSPVLRCRGRGLTQRPHAEPAAAPSRPLPQTLGKPGRRPARGRRCGQPHRPAHDAHALYGGVMRERAVSPPRPDRSSGGHRACRQGRKDPHRSADADTVSALRRYLIDVRPARRQSARTAKHARSVRSNSNTKHARSACNPNAARAVFLASGQGFTRQGF